MDKIGQVDKIGRLLSFASKGDVMSVKTLLDEGLPVDLPDYDGRTAMHLAASEGHYDVIDFLLKNNAHVNPVDRWRKTPLADARRYANLNGSTAQKHAYKKVCELLMQNGGNTSSPFEIDPAELKFQESHGKSAFEETRLANWRGTTVLARKVNRKVARSNSLNCESQLTKQLALLQSCRHPNIVQFLGAVTNYKSKSLVLVTEHLENGNLLELLHRKKGRIQPKDAVNYALDIARGMNYLHEHRPEPIVHGELNPMNLYRDAGGHLKVGGISMSKLIGCICPHDGNYSAIQNLLYTNFWRYVAPEFQKTQTLNRSSDVYSFGVIVHEMFEGPSLASRQAQVVAANRPGRDVFLVRTGFPPKLRELLEECCNLDPGKRPQFCDIIGRLEKIYEIVMKKVWWAPKPVMSFMFNFSDKYTLCILGAQKVWRGGSVTPRDDSHRGVKHRRGALITNCAQIKEED